MKKSIKLTPEQIKQAKAQADAFAKKHGMEKKADDFLDQHVKGHEGQQLKHKKK